MAAHNSPRGSFEEEAPLLSPTAFDAHAANPPQPPKKKKKPWLLLVILVFLLMAIVDMGAFMAEPPKTRVFEANLCVRYYEEKDPSKIRADGTVDETLCKVNEVQQKMAMIFGWQDMFDAIPGILLAVPFGTLADKWGRKWIFVASAMGLQLGSAWILMICRCARGMRARQDSNADTECRLFPNSPTAIDVVLLGLLCDRRRAHRSHCDGHYNGVGCLPS